MISGTVVYLLSLQSRLNKCMLVELTVVVNFNNFSRPLINVSDMDASSPVPLDEPSSSARRPLANVTVISTITSVQTDVKSLMEGAIFFPALSTPPSINPSKNVI